MLAAAMGGSLPPPFPPGVGPHPAASAELAAMYEMEGVYDEHWRQSHRVFPPKPTIEPKASLTAPSPAASTESSASDTPLCGLPLFCGDGQNQENAIALAEQVRLLFNWGLLFGVFHFSETTLSQNQSNGAFQFPGLHHTLRTVRIFMRHNECNIS